MKHCAHEYRYRTFDGRTATGHCQNYIADHETLCLKHDPARAAMRSAIARKRSRARRPQGLTPARPVEMVRVWRWFEHGGGAEAFAAFQAEAELPESAGA